MTLGDAGVVLALITSLAGLLTAKATKKRLYAEESKLKSDAAESISDAALALVEPLRKRLNDAEKEIADNKTLLNVMEIEIRGLKIQNEEFQRGIEKLKHQIMSLGHKPIYEGSM